MKRKIFTEEEEKEITHLYTFDKYCTLSFLAKKYKCSIVRIRNLLTSHKINIRGQAEAQTKRNVIEDKDSVRFWEKVEIKSKKCCWEWNANKDGCGYGRFAFRKKLLSAHRFAYILTHGEILNNKHVLHKCDNPCCCNPDHLFLGTHQDNMKDRNSKRRSKGGSLKGENNPRSRFTKKDIIAMRTMAVNGSKQKKIAKQFNTTQPVISGIINKKYWRHV